MIYSILYPVHASFYILFFRQCISLASSYFVLCNVIFYFVSCTFKFLYFIFLGSVYHWPLVILNHAIFILLLYFVHQYFFKSLSVGIKPEFIGITAHSLFIIKIYNCDFYLNKSSLKSSKFYFLF